VVTLSGAGQGYFDQVFCYSPDRLSRDAINQLLYEREIRDLGKEIIFVSESSDDTPEGHFIRIIRAGVSQ
jgi:DNA invertase Pin-like site-specific DNA recombinase